VTSCSPNHRRGARPKGTESVAVISGAVIVAGHDGRAEIELELTYPNGGVTTISLDEEACTASLDRAGVTSLEELVGQPWSIALAALETTIGNHARYRHS
jgi:hypothetical protein